MKRRYLIAGAIISGLLTPLSLLPLLFVINSVNPMQLVFITSITVSNQSGRTLDVIPVGTFNNGEKGPLPTFYTQVPAIPHLGLPVYQVKNGAAQKILFDCDDINFSDFIVRDATGEHKLLVADPNPPKKNYYAPRQKTFIIPEWNRLSPIDNATLVAATRYRGLIKSGWMVLAMALPPLFLIGFLLALARVRQGQSDSPMPPP